MVEPTNSSDALGRGALQYLIDGFNVNYSGPNGILPEPLKQELLKLTKEELRVSLELSEAVQTEEEWQAIRRILAREAATLSNPYHNLEHMLVVEQRVRRVTLGMGLSTGEVWMLRVAALAHDLYHCGLTYRQLSATNTGEYPGLSNEEVAVLKVDALLADQLSVGQRVALQGLILATTYGQDDPDRVPDASLYRPYQASSDLERLIAFADANNLESTLETTLWEYFLLCEEAGDETVAFDRVKTAGVQLSFLEVVIGRLKMLSALLSPETFSRLLGLADIRRRELIVLRDDAESPEALLFEAIVATYKHHAK